MKLRLSVAGVPAIAALGGLSSQPVLGQEPQGEGGFEEVVVTATRRTLDIQDVPVSVRAMTDAQLEMQGIETIEGLQGTIPNLNVIGDTAGGLHGANFSIRGIPRVGFYVDGIWQPYAQGMMEFSLEDIQRIELLRGPQGTLYGRDSTGGAIRVVTKEPADEFGGRASVTLGTYNRQDASLSIDIPLAENLNTRFSANQLNRDGYVYSITEDTALGQIDMTNMSGDLVWSPTDRFSLRAKYSDRVSHPTDARISLWHVWQGANQVGFEYGPTGLYSLAGAPYDGEHHVAGYPGGRLGEWETALGDAEPGTLEVQQASVEIDYEVTDAISLQSWTAYIDQYHNGLVDYDNAEWEVATVNEYRKNQLFSQEVQLSGAHGRFDWVSGLYYWNESSGSRDAWWGFEEFQDGRLDREAVLQTPQCMAPTDLLGCAGAFGVYESIGNSDEIAMSAEEGYAVFGEVDIALTERMDLTLGARYHDQDVEDAVLDPIPGVTAPVPDEIGPLSGGDPFAGYSNNIDRVSFDAFTNRVALTRRFSDDIMGYIGYTEGFNAGGADPVATETGRRLIKYDPERIKNYELGVRSELLDGQVRFNATLFHTDWENIQLESNFVDPDIGVYAVTIITQNAAGADADGLETEFTWLPTDNLELNVNLGLLDTEYTTFLLGEDTPVSSGDSFAQAPEETYSVGLQHVARLGEGATLTSRLDYSYVSGFQRFPDPTYHPDALGLEDQLGEYEAGDYGMVNARFVYTPADSENWELAVFGTNLTNERVINGGFYGSIWEIDMSTVARPREAGVELNVFFD